MKSTEAIKERIRVHTEKLKIVATVIILLTGGLTGLMFKGMNVPLNITLFVGGLIGYIFAWIYLWNLNNTIENLLNSMEEDNV